MLKKLSNKALIVVVVLLISIGGYYFFRDRFLSDSVGEVEKIQATLYKSATCSCCLGHAGYLGGKGFDVKRVTVEDINSVKEKNNIPFNMQSCHTTEIGDYFVEGHVPVEAVEKLLVEKPDIDGIALPDMPAGSPGMPGIKREEFVIYSLKDGQSEEFMRI
jgi:hypothetical protein